MAGLLADQQRVQPRRTLWQVYAFRPLALRLRRTRRKRDHRNENARRAKAGLPSLEEEALAKAKEEAERKATQGYQRPTARA